ncbi:MAG: hypothetical protein IT305_19205 [Chloroflexi bacterium]|nr:hypothetical protein [Chloroflexota bacterium]
MSRRASVQTSRLSLEEIADDVVLLARGQYRAVLEINGVHFGLQGETEQESLVGGFAAFLNSLSFPIQILVRVLPVDVDGYIGDLERRARNELPENLAALARDHVAFVRRLARNRTLLERHFYLVVPAETEATRSRRGWPFGRGRAGRDTAAARKQLVIRCEEVERQLGRCGLTPRRLTSNELAQLYYACWCPELSRVQRLRRDLVEYTTLVVQAGAANGRSS